MKKVFLTAMFTAVVSGAAYAGGSAIADLKSNAPLSALDGVSIETPKAAMSAEIAPKSDSDEFSVKQERYFFLDRNFSRLFAECGGNVSCQDKLRQDYVEARDNFWTARSNLMGVVLEADAQAYDNVLGPLTATVKAAQKDELTGFGYLFALKSYPANTKTIKILADIVSYDETEMAGYFKMSSGDPAVRTLAKDLRAEAKVAGEDQTGDENAVIIKNIQAVAIAAEKAFLGTNRFVKIQLASHDRQEDGDLDYRILIAQEKDGALRVLSYIRNPY
jgi:hypothetical protein